MRGSYNKRWSKKIFRIHYIILSIFTVSIVSILYSLFQLISSTHSFLIKFNSINFQSNHTTVPSMLSVSSLLLNLTFVADRIYHHDGIAYDYYSKNDLNQSKAAHQWKTWALPNEINQSSSIDHIEISPFVVSKLPFVDAIYVLTDSRFIERHDNLKKALDHQGISIESIEWRLKWNRTTCNSNSSHSYVYQRLNLKNKPLENHEQQRCAVAMKHVDVWYEIAERKIGLALILEDDAIFVPFFKEKFIRMIYASMLSGILRINGTCVKPKEKSISNDERIHQNPMIVIGTCLSIHSGHFQRYLSNAPPLLSTNKLSASRCTHAYLLTSCSAQALIDQIQAQKNNFENADHMQNSLFRLSPTLQSFWMDPPLAYQGNQVVDLDKLSSFKIQTYIL